MNYIWVIFLNHFIAYEKFLIRMPGFANKNLINARISVHVGLDQLRRRRMTNYVTWSIRAAKGVTCGLFEKNAITNWRCRTLLVGQRSSRLAVHADPRVIGHIHSRRLGNCS